MYIRCRRHSGIYSSNVFFRLSQLWKPASNAILSRVSRFGFSLPVSMADNLCHALESSFILCLATNSESFLNSRIMRAKVVQTNGMTKENTKFFFFIPECSLPYQKVVQTNGQIVQVRAICKRAHKLPNAAYLAKNGKRKGAQSTKEGIIIVIFTTFIQNMPFFLCHVHALIYICIIKLSQAL